MKFNIFSSIAWFVLVCAGLLVIYMGYLFLYPYNPIEYKTVPIHVLKKELYPGDTIPLQINYCKWNSKPLKIYAQISGEFVKSIPSQDRSLESGCHKIISYFWKIPIDLSPGNYKYEFTVVQDINDLRSVSVYIETEPFTVLDDGKKNYPAFNFSESVTPVSSNKAVTHYSYPSNKNSTNSINNQIVEPTAGQSATIQPQPTSEPTATQAPIPTINLPTPPISIPPLPTLPIHL